MPPVIGNVGDAGLGDLGGADRGRRELERAEGLDEARVKRDGRVLAAQRRDLGDGGRLGRLLGRSGRGARGRLVFAAAGSRGRGKGDGGGNGRQRFTCISCLAFGEVERRSWPVFAPPPGSDASCGLVLARWLLADFSGEGRSWPRSTTRSQRRERRVLAFSGEGGIGKTRLLDELRRARRRRAGAERARVGARARAAVRRVGGRADRPRRVPRRRPARAARRRSAAGARRGAALGRPRAGRPAGRALPHAPRRTGAAGGAGAAAGRSCSCWTTCSGPTTRRWSWSRRCCGGRRAGGCCSRWPSGPRRCGRCSPPRWPPPSATGA